MVLPEICILLIMFLYDCSLPLPDSDPSLQPSCLICLPCLLCTAPCSPDVPLPGSLQLSSVLRYTVKKIKKIKSGNFLTAGLGAVQNKKATRQQYNLKQQPNMYPLR